MGSGVPAAGPDAVTGREAAYRHLRQLGQSIIVSTTTCVSRSASTLTHPGDDCRGVAVGGIRAPRKRPTVALGSERRLVTRTLLLLILH